MLLTDRRIWSACVRGLALIGVLSAVVLTHAAAQNLPVTEVAYVFRFSPTPLGASAAVGLPAVLRRRLTLKLDRVTLERALRAIVAEAQLDLSYSRAVVPLSRKVSVAVKQGTTAEALRQVLYGVPVELWITRSGKAALVPMMSGAIAVDTEGGVIVGRVTDAKTGTGVAGAEIFLEKTSWRTTADTSGRYRLTGIDAGSYTLAIRRFGYVKQSRPVTMREDATDTVDVALDPSPSRLNDLVSTATGRERRLYITNDITTINADSVVKNQPITSVTDLLEYRVPGLTVQRTSGAPGDPARLRLRGAGSPLHSNDPIVIVDGIRVYAEQSAGRGANLASISRKGDTTSAFNYATPSPLDYIDPNTIERIEVVKGPSAATLYGPDAANGVIVITTKKGHAGPTRWSFIADHGTSRTPGSFPDLTLRWGHLQYVDEAPVQCTRSNTVGTPSFYAGQPCIADSVVSYQLLNDPDLTVLDRGNRNALSLTAQGGTSALTYAVTGSFGRTEGLFKLPGNEVDRYQLLHDDQLPPDWMQRPQHLDQWGVAGRFGVRLGSTANLELTSNFSHTNQQRSSLERQLGSLLTTMYDRASGVYYTADVINASITNNSDAILSNYYQRVTSGAAQFTNGLSLQWQPLSWLTVNSNAGLNVDQRDDEVFIPRGVVTGGTVNDSAGSLNNGHGTSVVSTVNAYGTATIPIGLGLRLDFSTGVNYTGRSISDLTVNSRHLAPGTSSLGDTIVNSLRNQENNATFGWYMAQSFTHRKFAISTGLRFDGGSNYGSHVSTTGGLPKLGGSYLLSDESWFPFKNLFQSFKVRASYGRATRQPGISERLRLYTVVSPQPVNGVPVDVVGLKALGNTELRPERTSEFEGGFDTDVLDNRLSLSFTLYRKTTDDALINFPVPPSVYGVGNTISRNIGEIRNTGLNVDATAQLIRSGPVAWGVGMRISRNQNVVVRLGPGVEAFYIGGENTGGARASTGLRVAAGYPLFSRWAKPILGYADANGDGALEASEVVFGDTAVYLGRTDPNYQLDLNTDLSFARGAITLSLGAHYDDGFTQLDELSWELSSFAAALNSGTSTLEEQAAWINVGSGQTPYNFFQTVHVFRLQSLALRYRIPQSLARRMGAQELNVQVQGTNLQLWTNYRGIDPNVNSVSTGSAKISDNGVLPQPRSWQVRINATY